MSIFSDPRFRFYLAILDVFYVVVVYVVVVYVVVVHECFIIYIV